MNDILFGNTNRPVIKKLAGRYFKSSKSRNVIAVIAIILTRRADFSVNICLISHGNKIHCDHKLIYIGNLPRKIPDVTIEITYNPHTIALAPTAVLIIGSFSV